MTESSVNIILHMSSDREYKIIKNNNKQFYVTVILNACITCQNQNPLDTCFIYLFVYLFISIYFWRPSFFLFKGISNEEVHYMPNHLLTFALVNLNLNMLINSMLI